jgi:hypothetical protein
MKTLKYILIAATILTIGLIANSCKEDLFLPDDIRNSIGAPIITHFEPDSGRIGTEIVVTGDNLSSVLTEGGVTIGGRPTEVLYRYSNSSIVLQLVGTEVSGPIQITNNKGSFTTTENFKVIDVIPDIESIRNSGGNLTELVDSQRIEIRGQFLNAVRRVTFGEHEIIGRMIDRNDTVLIIEIPYLEDDEATINLEYRAEGQWQVFKTISYPVNYVMKEPVITNTIPDETNPGGVITLQGQYMDRISKVKLVGSTENPIPDSNWVIFSQTRTTLRVLVPKYEAGLTVGDLTIIHNKERTEKVVKSSLKIVNEDVLNYKMFRNVTMALNRMPEQENFNNFFDLDAGELFTPCDWQAVDISEVTTFFFSHSASTVQLNNPASSVAQFQNFRCEGVQVLQGMRGGKATRYRTLRPDVNVREAELTRMVLDQEIDDINLKMLDGWSGTISDLTSNNPRWTGSTNTALESSNWSIGSVIVFREYTGWAGDGAGGVGGRFGFIHIVNVDPGPNFDPSNPAAQTEADRRQSLVTINVYFQKVKEESK